MALPLVLASASPRRAELLRQAGIPFEVVPADVDEDLHPGEDAEAYVRRVAAAKAAHVAASHPGRSVLGADTTVVLDEEVLGKPGDAAEALSMLGRLSGRSHRVLTGLCLITPGRPPQTAVSATTVEFLTLDTAQISAYVATGEPMDKAGAYAIQGGAGRFVRNIDGELANVIGLPISLVKDLLSGV